MPAFLKSVLISAHSVKIRVLFFVLFLQCISLWFSLQTYHFKLCFQRTTFSTPLKMPCKATKRLPFKKGHDFACFVNEFFSLKLQLLFNIFILSFECILWKMKAIHPVLFVFFNYSECDFKSRPE